MARKSEDQIVLDYHDSLLRESDLKLLDKPNWLNDHIIGFVFEYFEFEKYKSVVDEKKIVFLNPCFTQILKIYDGQIEELLDPLEISTREIIIFPISNNSSPTKAGGSHWSLIMINKKQQKFVHYDSYNSSNTKIAVDIFKKLKFYFKCETFEDDASCPQQDNTIDCGVYLLAFADSIANSVLTNESIEMKEITPDFVDKLRIYYKNLIISLKNKS